MSLQWINSSGGPLLCASTATGKMWRGIGGSSVGGAQSDYERACEQVDYASVIACDSSQVIVFGDEPLQAAFFSQNEDLMIVRWVSCISNEFAINAISQLPSKLPGIEEPTEFHLSEAGLIMFDAALDSVDPSLCARMDVKPGAFTVTTERYKSQGVYEFIVHRFLRRRDEGSFVPL